MAAGNLLSRFKAQLREGIGAEGLAPRGRRKSPHFFLCKQIPSPSVNRGFPLAYTREVHS